MNSTNNNGNLKLLGIIVAGVLIALIAFTIGQGAWDSHKEAVARDEATRADAARAAERQSYLDQQKKEAIEQQAAEQRAMVAEQEANQRQQPYKAQLEQLHKLSQDISYSAAMMPVYQKAIDEDCGTYPSGTACYDHKQSLENTSKYLNQNVTTYNTIAANIPKDVLAYAQLAAKYNDSGTAVWS